MLIDALWFLLMLIDSAWLTNHHVKRAPAVRTCCEENQSFVNYNFKLFECKMEKVVGDREKDPLADDLCPGSEDPPCFLRWFQHDDKNFKKKAWKLKVTEFNLRTLSFNHHQDSMATYVYVELDPGSVAPNKEKTSSVRWKPLAFVLPPACPLVQKI